MVLTTTQEAESTTTATEAVRPFVPRSTANSLLRPLETLGGKVYYDGPLCQSKLT